MRVSSIIPLFLSVTPLTAAWWLETYSGENCGGQHLGTWISEERHDQCESLESLIPIKSVKGDGGAQGVLQVWDTYCDNSGPETRSWYVRNACVNAGSWGEWKGFRLSF